MITNSKLDEDKITTVGISDGRAGSGSLILSKSYVLVQ